MDAGERPHTMTGERPSGATRPAAAGSKCRRERLTGRQESVSLPHRRSAATRKNGSWHSGSRGFAVWEEVGKVGSSSMVVSSLTRMFVASSAMYRAPDFRTAVGGRITARLDRGPTGDRRHPRQLTREWPWQFVQASREGVAGGWDGTSHAIAGRARWVGPGPDRPPPVPLRSGCLRPNPGCAGQSSFCAGLVCRPGRRPADRPPCTGSRPWPGSAASL
jgi:hypothetical protein